jgi:hypothetical protein
MATVQLGTTKSAGKLTNYAEKKAIIKDGVNVDADYAKSQMKMTREMYGKDDGIQAHHVIQSFQPGEVTPEKANEIGLELAEKLAPGHEVAVYTHNDTDHIHNHLVINSVNFETGKKYQAHGKEAIERTRSISDEICKSHDLSIVTEHTAGVRHTLAEQHLLEKNQPSWKEELRQAIEYARDNTTDFDSFKSHLEAEYGVSTKMRGKTLSFKHPDRKRFIRANKLGADYEREGLENVFARQTGREQEHEGTLSRDKGIKRTDDELYQSADERGHGAGRDHTQSIESNSRDFEPSHEEHGINLDEARKAVKGRQRAFASDFDQWTRGNARKQQKDRSRSAETSADKRHSAERNEQRDQGRNKSHEKQSERSSKKRKERSQELSL